MSLLLKLGSVGPEVQRLQHELARRGLLDSNSATGRFGPETDRAVREFQQAIGLIIDGKVGVETAGALFPSETNNVTFDPKSILLLPGTALEPRMNFYKHGLVQNTCHTVRNKQAIYWESKFDIDGDGISPPNGDPTKLPNTSLHFREADGTTHPLDSLSYPFAVLPDPRDDRPFRPQNLGLDLGDIGICFYHSMRAAFVFGDTGPKRVDGFGEGSIYLAGHVGVDPDPDTGGLQDVPPGVIFISFPGSRDRNDATTSRSPSEIEAASHALLAKLLTV